MSNSARHFAEKFHVIVSQRGDACEMIGKLGERETGLHQVALDLLHVFLFPRLHAKSGGIVSGALRVATIGGVHATIKRRAERSYFCPLCGTGNEKAEPIRKKPERLRGRA